MCMRWTTTPRSAWGGSDAGSTLRVRSITSAHATHTRCFLPSYARRVGEEESAVPPACWGAAPTSTGGARTTFSRGLHEAQTISPHARQWCFFGHAFGAYQWLLSV